MTLIRTSNLTILQTQMLGGQIDLLGGFSESDHSFTQYNDHLKTEGKFDLEKIKNHIEFYISEYGDNKFTYYNETYKLKMPKKNNLNLLSKRIKKFLLNIDNQRTAKMKMITSEDIQKIKLLLETQKNDLINTIEHMIKDDVWQEDIVEKYIKQKYEDVTDEEMNDCIEENNLRDLQNDLINSLIDNLS